ncbi:MAG TPA: CARDB domain-containing protein [Hymenobacter sp.]|jgi:hypothetical protein|uniref:CARDB domain-containing protein n=1 Tax=Hymenobacter sp. TaxID=1898978 RepID=UPI002ED7D586
MDFLNSTRRCGLGLAMLLAAAGALVPARAQTAPSFDRVEYFFDADPGFGQGTPVTLPATPGTTLSALPFSADLTSLPAGFHTLFVRTRAGANNWSQTYRQILYKEPAAVTAAPPANLAAVEYFVDTDPGYGQGSSAAITGGSPNAPGVAFSLSLGAVPAGFHTLYYRVRDAANHWSQTQGRVFYVDEPAITSAPTLNKAEYYVDADPGYGAGTDVPIAAPAGTLANLSLLADLSGLADGPHRLFLRVRDANGRWSMVLNRPFAKSGCSSSPNYAAQQPATGYSSSGVSAGTAAAIFNAETFAFTSGSTFFNNYYAQVDLGAALLPFSEVQLSLQNVNSTAVNYTLQVETSADLSTWNVVDSYSATLAASQAAPVRVVRSLASPQNNVRGLRLRLLLPAVAQGIQLSNAGAYYFNCAGPAISSFTPLAGPAGTAVTLTGTNFGGATLVRFNGTTAPGFVINGAGTEITVPVPTGATTGPITVTTPAGTATSPGSFTVPAPPTISSFTPATGASGTTVTITGTNLTGTSSVRFNGTGASFSAVTGTSVTAVVPAGATTGPLSLTTPDGTATSASSFVLDTPPTLVSLDPASGPAGTLVTLTGTNLLVTNVLSFNGVAATRFTVVSSTQLTAVVPATASTGTVEATTPRGTARSAGSFVVEPTTLAAFAPTCVDAPPVALAGGSPGGGSYSGPGVSGGQFSPAVVGVGTFTLTYTYSLNGVSTAATQPLTVLPRPVLTASDTLLCNSPSALLAADDAGPGASYLWSTGATTASIQASPATRTAYTVEVTNAAGCTYRLRQVISPSPGAPPAAFSLSLPAANAGGVDPAGGILSWNPSANATAYDVYVWPSAVATRPAAPTFAGVTAINLALTPALVTYATAYQWQVVARTSCAAQSSVVRTFTTLQLPDLRVTSISAPANGLLNQTLSVSWTVQNAGTNTTGNGQWEDYVYLSFDHSVGEGADVVLGSYPNQQALLPGQRYTQTQTVTLPKTAVGAFHLYVLTNTKAATCGSFLNGTDSCLTARTVQPGLLREATYQNNWRHQLITLRYPPVPDLAVSSVAVPSVAFAGSNLTVTYRLKNRGPVAARGTLSSPGSLCEGNYWRNGFYLSQDSVLSPQTDVMIGFDPFYPKLVKAGRAFGLGCDPLTTPPNPYSDELEPDSTLLARAIFTLPHNVVGGTYYLLAVADIGNNVYEGPSKNNNVRSSAALQVNLAPPPDLLVTRVAVPATAGVGQPLAVSWDVENQGAKAPHPTETTWYDHVYLSRLPVFQLDSARLLGSQVHDGGSAFVPGKVYSQTTSFVLPRGLSGSFYVYVWTDARRQVFEYTGDNNNITRSPGRVTLSYTTYPDLLVTSIVAPDTVRTGKPFTVQWTVKNLGLAAVTVPFNDEIRLSRDTTLALSGTLVGNVSSPGGLLAPGQSLTKTYTATLLSGQGYGNQLVHFFVRTDAPDAVYEYGAESNNLGSTHRLKLQRTFVRDDGPRAFDLQVTALSAPASAGSGSRITVAPTIRNAGPDAIGLRTSWLSTLVLSTDTLLDRGDVSLAALSQAGPLASGSSLSSTLAATIPNGLSGSYYLLYLADLDDDRSANNLWVHPLTVQLSAPADLVVSSLSVADTLFAGQVLQLPFELTNQGTGPALPAASRWFTGAYLSATAALNRGSVQVGSQLRTAPLAAGASVRDSALVTVPRTYQGNYYLIVKADNGNEVYEHNAEANNTRSRLVYVKAAPQSDLVMTALSVPATATLGSAATLTYTVQNIGAKPTLGSLTNNLYWAPERGRLPATETLFSADAVSTVLAPGQQLTRSVAATPRTLRPGHYRGIAQANARQTVAETSYANNRLLSLDSTLWQVNPLALGVPATGLALATNDHTYYQLSVGANLDVLISLTSPLAAASNEVYVAYERIPTSSDFDFRFQAPQSANQEVVIPGTRAGRYFIYVHTLTAGIGGQGQGASLLAESLPYAIRSIAPAIVGQGVVTTTLRGAGFRTPTLVRLRNAANAIVATAQVVSQTSSMELRLRWNLTAVPVGTYTVETQNPDNTVAQLVSGLRVVPATPLSVDYLPTVPSVLAAGRSGLFSFTFRNTSNVDIPVMHGQFSMMQTVKVVNVRGTDGNPLLGSAWSAGRTIGVPVLDWYTPGDGLVYVPFIARDVRPGAEVTVQFTADLRAYGLRQLSVHPTVYLYQKNDLLARLGAYIETTRRAMVADPVFMNVSNSPAVLALLPNRVAFTDTMLTRLFEIGLLQPADTVGFDLGCNSCLGFEDDSLTAPTRSYTFSPGTALSSETAGLAAAVFGPGEDYLWNINKYGGAAGSSPGWDLIRLSGGLTVQATAAQPFVVHLSSTTYQKQAGLLAGWYPAVDGRWPIVVAAGGITGFAADKFSINTDQFTAHNNLYGGRFSVRQAGDTLLLVFTATRPGVGAPGVPGAPGAPGEAGSPGGPGGPGNGVVKAGPGGAGGQGGNSVPATGSTPAQPAGSGGAGGAGGTGGPNQSGGTGGEGGTGGAGLPSQPGGPSLPGGNGGAGGAGGAGSAGMPAGPGGNGGAGGRSSSGGPSGSGGAGGGGFPGGSGGSSPSSSGGGLLTPLCGRGGPPGGESCEDALDFFNDSRKLAQAAADGDVGPALTELLLTRGGKFIGKNPDNCGIEASLLFSADVIGILAASPSGFPVLDNVLKVKDALISAGQYGLRMGNCVNKVFFKEVFLPDGKSIVDDWIDALDCAKGTSIGDVAWSAGSCGAKAFLCVPIVASCDPNEIIGPDGYGAPLYVAATATLPYKVMFENDELLASAPAQRVNVRVPLDANLNPLSVRLGEVNFHNMTLAVPAGLASYSTVFHVADSIGVDVEMTAGIDVVRREVFWEFQSIDPATGLPPANPLLGFLPPNDSTREGEGYVTYTVRPRRDAATGDSLRAQATIAFDFNDVILTNRTLNLVDAGAPSSAVASPISSSANLVYQIGVGTQDDAGGSGVRHYDLYLSKDGVNYEPFLTGQTEPSVAFTAQAGQAYYFYSLATDNVGNQEAPKTRHEAVIAASGNPLPVQLTHFTAERRGTTAYLNWATATEKNCAGFAVEVSLDGFSFRRLGWVAGQGTTGRATTYRLDDAELARYGVTLVYYRLRQVDTDGSEAFSPVRSVAVPPDVLAKAVLSVWPNPAHLSATVSGASAGTPVLVYDAVGHIVLSTTMPVSGNLELQLPGTLTKGLYLVRAGKQSCRLIIE